MPVDGSPAACMTEGMVGLAPGARCATGGVAAVGTALLGSCWARAANGRSSGPPGGGAAGTAAVRLTSAAPDSESRLNVGCARKFEI